MDEDAHEHEGSFSSGLESGERHPERERKGRFGDVPDEGEHVHEGSFAAGQETSEHHPEDEQRGRFGSGGKRPGDGGDAREEDA